MCGWTRWSRRPAPSQASPLTGQPPHRPAPSQEALAGWVSPPYPGCHRGCSQCCLPGHLPAGTMGPGYLQGRWALDTCRDDGPWMLSGVGWDGMVAAGMVQAWLLGCMDTGRHGGTAVSMAASADACVAWIACIAGLASAVSFFSSLTNAACSANPAAHDSGPAAHDSGPTAHDSGAALRHDSGPA